MRRFLALAVLLCLASAALAQNAAPAATLNSISGDRIRAHVKFLSSDFMEGRGTGQRGGDLAAEYLATEFALEGLKPGGENGTYFQKVPMVGISTEPSTTLAIDGPKGVTSLKMGDDVVAGNQSQEALAEIDAPIVFVGYGIEAPEFKWDDYKGADLKGKVLLMFVNEPVSEDPKFFNAKSLTYYGRWTYKYEEAARRGAAGVLLIHKTDMASYGWEVVQNSWGAERAFLAGDNSARLKLAGWVQLEVAKKLLAESGQDFDALFKQAQSRDFKPIALPLRLKAHVASKIRQFASSNVIGIVPGADFRLKDQAVIYSAHYDHLGIHLGMPGDNIYNGAVDNATGCGVLLEMARAAAHSAEQPKREMIFAAVTGEEMGLLGSEYLAKHPPVPAANISLGLNFDSFVPYGIPEQVRAGGADRTTFFPTLEQIAKEFQFELMRGGTDAAGGYYRSDHFSFAHAGIPAFSIGQGGKFRGRTEEWVKEQNKKRGNTYHQPTDEFRDDWDFSGLAELARFGLALGWKAADQPQEVEWQKGDEFERARLGH
jgi:Zn-dependent M28 family amino/carboxypeptidase